MRTVFFGATRLGLACLEALLEAGQEVAGVVSIPERFPISYSSEPVRNVTYVDFAQAAAARGIPYAEVTSGRPEPALLETIRSWRPDFGLAIGWFYVLLTELRNLFPLGVAGLHASLLPRYRGGAPLVWAIMNGERETGVTLFYLDEGVDTGDVIARRAFPIDSEDDIASVLAKATAVGQELVREYVPLVADGKAPRGPQDESQATAFPQRRPEDALIDWSRSAHEIRDFIRAQTRPYPGAFTIIEGKRVTIWDADIAEVDEEPGSHGGGTRS